MGASDKYANSNMYATNETRNNALSGFITAEQQALLLKLFPWALLWLSLNVGLYTLSPPNSAFHLVQNARVFFPAIAGVLAVIGLFVVRNRWKRFWSSPLVFFFAYGITAFLASLLYSPQLVRSVYWGVSYLAVFPVLLFVLSGKNNKKSVESLLAFNRVAVVLVALMAFCIVAFLGINSFVNSDLSDSFGAFKPNGMGRFAALAALIGFVWVFHSKKPLLRGIAGAFFGLMLGLVVFSYSRTAMLALIAAILVVLFCKSKKLFFATTVLGVIAAIILFPVIVDVLDSKYAEVREERFDPGLLTGRLRTWNALIDFWQESPIIGFGYHADRILIASLDDKYLNNHAHNAFIHSLIQAGVLGAGFFVAGLLFALYLAFSLLKRKKLPAPALEAMAFTVFFVVRGVFESSGAFFGVDFLLMLPAIAALTFYSRRGEISE